MRVHLPPFLTFIVTIVMVGAVYIGVGIITNSHNIALGAPPAGCAIPDAPGRIFIDLGSRTLFVSQSGGVMEKGPFSTNLPAGAYKVILASFDDHTGSPPEPEQINERWQLDLFDSGGNLVATTQYINDLPDAQDSLVETVNFGLALPSTVTSVVARHIESYLGVSNSIRPRCAAFDPVAQPVVPAPPPTCPIVDAPGRIFAHVGGNFGYFDHLVADETEALARTGPFSVNIPQGTYEVTMVSWNEHFLYPAFEPEEAWFLELRDASNSIVAATSPIADLPDDQDWLVQQVDTALVVPTTITSVSPFHAYYFDNNTASVLPACAAFDGAFNPDLEVTLFSVPNGWAGQTVNAAVRVDNIGTDNTGPFEVALNRDSNTMDCSTVEHGSVNVTDIPPGSFRTLSIPFTYSTAPGTYTAAVMADSDCSVSEPPSETNNTLATPYTTTPQPTIDLDIDPLTISVGEMSTLTWSSTNATSCAGTNFSTGGATSGNVDVSPIDTTTYGLQCNNVTGFLTDSETVTVKKLDIHIEIDLPLAVVLYGDPIDLIWSANNVDSCQVHDEDGNLLDQMNGDANGAISPQTVMVGSVTEQTTYTASCVNAFGVTDSASATIRLVPQFRTF